tara:strand:- start:137 stop:934 length:798 start_codon:yes stop_codon:yes gene_type:complete
MCSPKEPHFLINKEIGKQRIHKGIIALKDYESLFGEKAHLKYRGESSVMYLPFPEIAIKNIKHYLDDDIKIIIMLRNPVERAYSGYQHVKRYNMMENLSFEDALELGEERYHDIKNFTPASRYLELGNYYNQVNVFKKSFDNIHVVIYDDYKTDFNEELNKIFDYLEVVRITINAEQQHMVGGWEWKSDGIKKIMIQQSLLKLFLRFIIPFKSLRQYIRVKFQKANMKAVEIINPETEKWLKEYYKQDVARLSELLNRDLNHWII